MECFVCELITDNGFFEVDGFDVCDDCAKALEAHFLMRCEGCGQSGHLPANFLNSARLILYIGMPAKEFFRSDLNIIITDECWRCKKQSDIFTKEEKGNSDFIIDLDKIRNGRRKPLESAEFSRRMRLWREGS